jgi:hypothetical protein
MVYSTLQLEPAMSDALMGVERFPQRLKHEGETDPSPDAVRSSVGGSRAHTRGRRTTHSARRPKALSISPGVLKRDGLRIRRSQVRVLPNSPIFTLIINRSQEVVRARHSSSTQPAYLNYTN